MMRPVPLLSLWQRTPRIPLVSILHSVRSSDVGQQQVPCVPVINARSCQHDSRTKKPARTGKIYIANRFIAPSDTEIPNGNLLANPDVKGQFLTMRQCLEMMSCREAPYFQHIPLGIKENTYFMVDNRKNIQKREQRKHAQFVDDCGSWYNKSRANVYCRYYFILKAGKMHQIRRIQGNYIYQKLYKPRLMLVPIEPQPLVENVMVVVRYRSVHALSADYIRSITEVQYLPTCFESMFNPCVLDTIFVQYRGTFPGYVPHGSSLHSADPYVRLPAPVTEFIDDCIEQGVSTPTVILKLLVERELLLWTKQNLAAVNMRVHAKKYKGRSLDTGQEE